MHAQCSWLNFTHTNPNGSGESCNFCKSILSPWLKCSKIFMRIFFLKYLRTFIYPCLWLRLSRVCLLLKNQSISCWWSSRGLTTIVTWWFCLFTLNKTWGSLFFRMDPELARLKLGSVSLNPFIWNDVVFWKDNNFETYLTIFKLSQYKKVYTQRQITLKIVGYHFSSQLTATLNLCLIYVKLLVHVL